MRPIKLLELLIVAFWVFELSGGCRSLVRFEGLLVVEDEGLVFDTIVPHEQLALVNDHGDALEAFAICIDGIDLLPVA